MKYEIIFSLDDDERDLASRVLREIINSDADVPKDEIRVLLARLTFPAGTFTRKQAGEIREILTRAREGLKPLTMLTHWTRTAQISESEVEIAAGYCSAFSRTLDELDDLRGIFYAMLIGSDWLVDQIHGSRSAR